MDKVLRYFTISDNVFHMHSRVEGEFGFQQLVTSASQEAEPNSVSIIQQVAAESAPADFHFRLGEMLYFLEVFKLFNPKFKTDYGLQEESQKES